MLESVLSRTALILLFPPVKNGRWNKRTFPILPTCGIHLSDKEGTSGRFVLVALVGRNKQNWSTPRVWVGPSVVAHFHWQLMQSSGAQRELPLLLGSSTAGLRWRITLAYLVCFSPGCGEAFCIWLRPQEAFFSLCDSCSARVKQPVSPFACDPEQIPSLLVPWRALFHRRRYNRYLVQPLACLLMCPLKMGLMLAFFV